MQSKPVAEQLPDLFAPRPIAKGFVAYCLRHPTMSFGALLLILMLVLAVFAPWLGTIDLTELAPIKRTRNRRPNIGSAPMRWVGIFIQGYFMGLEYRFWLVFRSPFLPRLPV